MMSLALLKESVKEYKRRGVSVSKLVLALPWFGMDWVVKHPSAGNTEYITSVASLSYDVIPASKREGGGCNASTPTTWWHERGGCYQFTCRSPDRPIVPGQKALYPMHCATAMGLLRVPGAVDLWDDESATRYIKFDLRSENGTVVHHEAWYDDARSLAQKYEYAREAGVQGIGMWTANDIDNSNSSQVASFWGAVRRFLPDAAPRGSARSVVSCPDKSDCTAAIQSALSNEALDDIVIPSSDGSPWAVGPLFIHRSHLRLTLEPGAVLFAKQGDFKKTGDCLLQIKSDMGHGHVSNITIVATGATLRMRKMEYLPPAYEKAEWRHTLSINGASDVTVIGGTYLEAGGDGIYVDGGGLSNHSRNILLSRVTADGAWRNGLSVISAINLTVADSTFQNTAGTNPQCGEHGRLRQTFLTGLRFHTPAVNQALIWSPTSRPTSSNRSSCEATFFVTTRAAGSPWGRMRLPGPEPPTRSPSPLTA